MIEYFAMGGYGVYIWPCYFLSFVLLIGIGRNRYKSVKELRHLANAKKSNPAVDSL